MQSHFLLKYCLPISLRKQMLVLYARKLMKLIIDIMRKQM